MLNIRVNGQVSIHLQIDYRYKIPGYSQITFQGSSLTVKRHITAKFLCTCVRWESSRNNLQCEKLIKCATGGMELHFSIMKHSTIV
ncbi:hypothetical protein D1872_311770 [compost metagenome]